MHDVLFKTCTSLSAHVHTAADKRIHTYMIPVLYTQVTVFFFLHHCSCAQYCVAVKSVHAYIVSIKVN